MRTLEVFGGYKIGLKHVLRTWGRTFFSEKRESAPWPLPRRRGFYSKERNSPSRLYTLSSRWTSQWYILEGKSGTNPPTPEGWMAGWPRRDPNQELQIEVPGTDSAFFNQHANTKSKLCPLIGISLHSESRRRVDALFRDDVHCRKECHLQHFPGDE